MIEINLIPDVKGELLRARRVRNNVVSVAILTVIVSIGITVMLLLYVFGVQTVRNVVMDNQIKDQNQKLQSVADLGKTLTIQNQLQQLASMHANKHMSSRVFDVLAAIIPEEPNSVAINNFEVDASGDVMTIKAQALNGYPALEVFKKTINATKFEYSDGTTNQTVALASDMYDTDRSYGEDASGRRVLRFTISFTYPDELLSPASKSARIVAPARRNVTDSYLGVPSSLFTNRSQDISGGQ